MTPMQLQPLAGVRVLDFSHVVAGPLATLLLSQLGAEVLKVEHPERGDVMRGSEKGAAPFLALNAGKQVVSLDLAQPEGRAQAHALLASCDILVDNLRPGVLTRYGLGYEALAADHPRLVYCAISGYGRAAGDWASRPAYDHVIQAATGMAWLSGEPDSPPVKVGFPVIDAGTGLLAALAMVSAWQEVSRTGRGCFLDVAMTQAALQLMYPISCDVLAHATTPARAGNRGFSGSPAADFFETADGWLALGANTPRQLAQLLQTLGLSAMLDDPELFEPGGMAVDGAPGFARARDPARVKQQLQARLAQEPSAQALEARLNAVGVPAAQVRTLDAFAREAEAGGAWQPTVLCDALGEVRTPGLGFQAYGVGEGGAAGR